MKYTKITLHTKSCHSSWIAFSTKGEVKRFSQNVLCCWLFSISQEEKKRGKKERQRRDLFCFFNSLDEFRCTHSSVIRGDQSSSSQLFTEIAIKQCVIFMPHLVTPSKHPHPTASRHPLLSCISSWFLVMFFAVCDTEAVGGLPFPLPLFLSSSTHYQCSTSDSACFLPSYTSHTQTSQLIYKQLTRHMQSTCPQSPFSPTHTNTCKRN